MAKIKTVNRTITVTESLNEVHILLDLKKWLVLIEEHRHIYEFSKKPDDVTYTNIILNRDYIVEITD